MKYDLVVSGGLVVTPDKIDRYDIGVLDGRIHAIAAPGTLRESTDNLVDAQGCYVIPGGVDPHVHYNLHVMGADGAMIPDEGPEYSFAAAYGGTTSIIDFAIWERLKYDADPTHTMQAAIARKHDAVRGKMSVDYGLHALLIGNAPFEIIDEIGDAIRNGIATIKTSSSCGAWTSDDGHRYGVMVEVQKHGGVHILHAEDEDLINWLNASYMRDGKTHGAYSAQTRGPLVEEAAIRRAILLSERTGCPLYVFHVSSEWGAQAIREARARGSRIFGETLSCYLSFTSDELWDDAKKGLVWNNTPSLKQASDRAALWDAIEDDALQVVSSDHWSVMIADRYAGMGDTVDLGGQAGQAAVELRLPLLFHMGVSEGRISMRRFVDLVSSNAAKLMGLYPKKGCIQVGSDADLVILDPQKEWIVSLDDLHMLADYNCWAGMKMRGKVRSTFLRGKALVLDEKWVGEEGAGQFVARQIDPSLLARHTTRSSTAF